MNISRFDLNLLAVFDALMLERNVTRAARRLHLSQPAVSHALQRLRHALKDPLLVRSGRDMVPTPRAESLEPVVRPLLESLSGALAGADFTPAELDQVFRLGMPDIGEFMLLPRLLPRMAAEAPRVRLAILDFEADTFRRSLATGEIDAVITAAQLAVGPGLHSRVLIHESRVVGVVRRDHPLAGGKLTPSAFRRMQRMAVTMRGGGVASPIEAGLAKQGESVEIGFVSPHFMAAPVVLLSSDMIFLVGEHLAARMAAQFPLRVIELPVKLPPIDAVLVWHERTHRDPAQRWFRDKIVESLPLPVPAGERSDPPITQRSASAPPRRT